MGDFPKTLFPVIAPPSTTDVRRPGEELLRRFAEMYGPHFTNNDWYTRNPKALQKKNAEIGALAEVFSKHRAKPPIYDPKETRGYYDVVTDDITLPSPAYLAHELAHHDQFRTEGVFSALRDFTRAIPERYVWGEKVYDFPATVEGDAELTRAPKITQELTTARDSILARSQRGSYYP